MRRARRGLSREVGDLPIDLIAVLRPGLRLAQCHDAQAWDEVTARDLGATPSAIPGSSCGSLSRRQGSVQLRDGSQLGDRSTLCAEPMETLRDALLAVHDRGSTCDGVPDIGGTPTQRG